ncbi:MAG: Tol-Pal system beta propeller repeat protein TolB [Candidatus Competibacterales bacterium]|nr:Tol-Pal system beta propeller repeat protein TolB [Candidatus Competibacterales bacterium]
MRALSRNLGMLTLCCLVLAVPARAQLTIEITQGIEGALPIAIVPFSGPLDLGPDEDIAAIVRADLHRSGRFEPLTPSRYQDRPGRLESVDFNRWRERNTDYLVVGEITPQGERYSVQFQLADIFEGRQLLGQVFTVGRREFRRLAHHISDLIYQQLTGERGAFSTRIAYVSADRAVDGGIYTLSVADADGFNARVILRSDQPLMSPAWSPDGTRLAYVSFENRRAQVVVQDVYSGRREVVSVEPGINGAPVWSPDGRRLALTLSRDGNPEIYLLDLASDALRRLTNNTAIDTEPSWSPDGRSLVFTSDRGGSPQIYRMAVPGGQPERLTFEGSYNARPVYSPDGERLALVHRRGERFHIAVLELDTGELQVLTDGRLDESPSFAPNGRMIIYATSQADRGVLAAVSVDGRVQQRLALQSGTVREPAWSPFLY